MKTLKIEKRMYRFNIYQDPKYIWSLIGILGAKDSIIQNANEYYNENESLKKKNIQVECVDIDIVNNKIRYVVDIKSRRLNSLSAKAICLIAQRHMNKKSKEMEDWLVDAGYDWYHDDFCKATV